MLKDFFEANTISLEVIELYDEYCLEKDKKTALNFVRREMLDEYKGERDSEIILFMTLYWCGLQKGFVSEKNRDELESITNNEICQIFDDDGNTVWTTLEELLRTEPIKSQRKKIDYSNPGSKNWKVGDLYAYQLSGEIARKIEHEGKYIIFYCYDIQKETRMTNKVTVYAFVGDEDTLTASPEHILENSVRVMSFASRRYYQYLLYSPHHEYPTDKLIYLGNTDKFVHADNECIPYPDIYKPFLVWKTLDDVMAHNIDDMLEKVYNIKSRIKN